MRTSNIETEYVNGRKYYVYKLRQGKRLTADNLQGFINIVCYIVHNIDLNKKQHESKCRLYDLNLDDTAIIDLNLEGVINEAA